VKAFWAILFLWFPAAGLAAETGEAQDGLFWFTKMVNASRQLNYNGTFVYRSATQGETSRIVHYVNAAGGEFEKLETLDGPRH
jgi:negative regulator of sigma E activity